MKLPTIDDLLKDNQQWNIYDFPLDQHLFVAGPPGSGKTSLAVHRAKLLAAAKKSVVLLTKNRMLASLAGQLGLEAFNTSTMHSYVASQYHMVANANVPQVAAYDWDWISIGQAYRGRGFAATLDHLIVDEGQNLPSAFYGWAVEFGAKNLSVFADEDQTTNAQRASLDQIVQAGLPNPIRLLHNHRNSDEIARVAEHFHRSRTLAPGIVRRGRTGDVPELVSVKSWDELVTRVKNRHQNRPGSIGVVVHQKLDAASVAEKLKAALPVDARIDVYTSDMPPGAEKEIRSLEEGVTVLTGESVIGMEFDTVYLHDLNRSLPCGSVEEFRRMYMLCARARDSLTLVNGPVALSAVQIADLPPEPILSRR